MDTDEHDRAVELLKEFGMKKYEAECFAALNSIPSGTARDVSDVADVPRTRVYDAVESLADQGFVEVQHANPQRFRAIPLDEALDALRQQYELRVEQLHDTLSALESTPVEGNAGPFEAWTLSTDAALRGRLATYLDEAEEEIVAVVGHEDAWTAGLSAGLQEARERDVDVFVGTAADVDDGSVTEGDVTPIGDDFGWLCGQVADDGPNEDLDEEDGALGCVVLVDREKLAVSTLACPETGECSHAVVAEGDGNGAVMLWERVLSGLLGEIPTEL